MADATSLPRQHDVPLSPAAQERLRAALQREGLRPLVERTGSSEIALLRAAAGLGVRRGTIALITAAVEL